MESVTRSSGLIKGLYTLMAIGKVLLTISAKQKSVFASRNITVGLNASIEL